MAQRLCTVLLVFAFGVLPIAAQNADSNLTIRYSVYKDDKGKEADPDLATETGKLISVANKGDHKEEKLIVVEESKDHVTFISPAKVAQIVLDKAGKDKIVLHDSSLVSGKILSSFRVTTKSGQKTITSANAKLLIFTGAKADKSCWTAPLHRDFESETKYRSLYPFWDSPDVFRVRSGLGCGLPKYCTLKESADKGNLRTCHKRFDDAANFPQLKFGEAGECIETPGAIIYEGMQLLIVEDGRFELAFNVSTPRVPVTMRLTLSVLVAREGAEKMIKLTIPAIAMVPDYRSTDEDTGTYQTRSNNYQENWHVRHVGYSEVLKDDLLAGGAITHYGRTGTARFGALPLSH